MEKNMKTLNLITIAAATLSVSMSVALADSNSQCFDVASAFAAMQALPANQLVREVTTDIEFEGSNVSQNFMNNVIRSNFENSTMPRSEFDDGSKTLQNGCESIEITYRNGRKDEYKITSYSPTKLVIEPTNFSDSSTTIESLSSTRIEMDIVTQVGEGQETHNVVFHKVQAWDSTLSQQEQISTHLLGLVVKALKAPGNQ
jgi:hypothetical protein